VVLLLERHPEVSATQLRMQPLSGPSEQKDAVKRRWRPEAEDEEILYPDTQWG